MRSAVPTIGVTLNADLHSLLGQCTLVLMPPDGPDQNPSVWPQSGQRGLARVAYSRPPSVSSTGVASPVDASTRIIPERGSDDARDRIDFSQLIIA